MTDQPPIDQAPIDQAPIEKPDVRFGVRTLLLFAALALIAVPFALLVLLVTAKVKVLQRIDQDIADALHSFAVRHGWFVDLMRWISDAGTSLGWWIVLTPVVLWLLWRRLFRLAIFVVVTMLGSTLLNNLVKAVVDRARPHLPDPVAAASGASFPSGHAQAATVGCGILVLVFLPVVPRGRRRWAVVAAVLIVATISFSRMALGVHYLSDVVGAIVLGAAWLLVMTAAFSAWRRERQRPAAGVTESLTEGLEPENRDRLAP